MSNVLKIGTFKMSEDYFNLKKKLEELGYNNTLPVEAVPLVECIIADLLQTTKSLQHYMNLSKELIQERDNLILEIEPFKCDNARLLQENNTLHKEIICVKEEYLRLSKETKRKIKSLSDHLTSKETLISKLQHDIRDLSLRGLCTSTLSSRNKSKKKDGEVENVKKICVCPEKKSIVNEIEVKELQRLTQSLEEQNKIYSDEIALLKKKVENRDSEISRLNIMLQDGHHIKVINKNVHSHVKMQDMLKRLHEMESSNDLLKKEIDESLKKQHEAMLRALRLADENKCLQEELRKVDSLALEVEEDCNRRLVMMTNEVNLLQSKLEDMVRKSSALEKKMFQMSETSFSTKFKDIQETLNVAIKEKEALKQEVNDLLNLNKSLQEKILVLTQAENSPHNKVCYNVAVHKDSDTSKCATKDDLKSLLENERKMYEKHMCILQEKLTETKNMFDTHLSKCNDKNISYEATFIKDMQKKLCESEQRILMLKKENEDLKLNTFTHENNTKQNYKDIINQLNAENAELTRENISLSRQLTQYKNRTQMRCIDTVDYLRSEIENLKRDLEKIKIENQTLRKDKQEYNSQLKDATSLIEKLKRDLAFKQNQYQQLEEENSSYKMTNRSGKASAERLKEECNFLKEQIKRMQSDVIKEKTLASQIRNIQIETERSSGEIQNELLHIQKQLSLSNELNESLDKKCKELQSEIMNLKADKSNVIENLKKIDRDRDRLVIELDNKTETICALEQKLKTQSFEVGKLENEVSDLKRKVNMLKSAEHKVADSESQVKFLNGENMRLTQQLDNAIMENKQLQNNLADALGNLKVIKIEHEKSRKEVESLKQQLQHYVAEVRHIEELLSHKEAERSDMLEKFASLSVEANILENTNTSLENESASKSIKLQGYITKIQDLENKLSEKDDVIDRQSAKIASMAIKITALENEVKLITEEKEILEKNISYLKKMCSNLEAEKIQKGQEIDTTDSELKLYENKIKSLNATKTKLHAENEQLKESVKTTEKLLSNARNEIVELKLALQDATSETKLLHEHINTINMKDSEIQGTISREALESSLLIEVEEIDREDDDDIQCHRIMRKRFNKYSHGGTI